jgi:hypothetical protein
MPARAGASGFLFTVDTMQSIAERISRSATTFPEGASFESHFRTSHPTTIDWAAVAGGPFFRTSSPRLNDGRIGASDHPRRYDWTILDLDKLRRHGHGRL